MSPTPGKMTPVIELHRLPTGLGLGIEGRFPRLSPMGEDILARESVQLGLEMLKGLSHSREGGVGVGMVSL